VDALGQGLRSLGYVEGKNIIIDYRYAEGNERRLSDLAAELVHLKVDALVVTGTQGAIAAKHATATIPIVMTTGSNPVARRIVASLAHPGGNITGLASDVGDLAGKRLELLKEAVSSISRVGVLWNPSDPGATANFKATETMARALAVQVYSLEVRSDLDVAFKAATESRVQALTVLSSGNINTYRTQIVDFATKNRLPTVVGQAALVQAGGLMYYGSNTRDLYRRAAGYVDKILKGAKPTDLPVELPTKFDLVINLKTARALGLKIPAQLLMEADRVIE
jgi:putative ABC transport system substrate-binding protein